MPVTGSSLEELETNGCGHRWSTDKPPLGYLREKIGVGIDARTFLVRGGAPYPACFANLSRLIFHHDSLRGEHNIRLEIDLA